MAGVNEKEEILKVYKSDSFREKVEKMSPAQITAIYIRLKNEGKLGR
jgi:hypothetical protein